MKRFKCLLLMLSSVTFFAACDSNKQKSDHPNDLQSNARPVGGMGSGTGHDYSNGSRGDIDTRREPAQTTKPTQQSSMLKQ